MKDPDLVCSIVSSYSDVYANLSKALALVKPLKLKSGQKVVIKINLCAARTADTGTITHPLFLDATLRYLRENYADLEIYVVESDATVVLADQFVVWLGIKPILDRWGSEFVNLSRGPVSLRKIDGRFFVDIPVPEIFDQCDFFITMPKLKTNPISTITCSLKNQFGCLPNADKGIYHPRLDDVICDVNRAIKPDLSIVDGIIAMGGAQGPSFGVPIPLRRVIAGKDPVAVDAYCARLIGFNPHFIGHIRRCASSHVGSFNYKLVGDGPVKTDFETSKIEMGLVMLGGALQKRFQRRFRSAGSMSK